MKPVGSHPGGLFWNAQNGWHLINHEMFIRVQTTRVSQAASSCWLNVTRIFFTSSFQSWARGGFGGDSRLLQTSYSRKHSQAAHVWKRKSLLNVFVWMRSSIAKTSSDHLDATPYKSSRSGLPTEDEAEMSQGAEASLLTSEACRGLHPSSTEGCVSQRSCLNCSLMAGMLHAMALSWPRERTTLLSIQQST